MSWSKREALSAGDWFALAAAAILLIGTLLFKLIYLPPAVIDSRGLGRADWLKAAAWLVELAEVRDHALVSNAVMAALDLCD